MATMIIAGERYQMPVWLKARLLDVQTTDDNDVLSVESGSERGKRYHVRHDGHVSTSCDCPATIPNCAHRLAAERYLVSVEVLGQQFASDLPAHIDDELASQDNGPEPGAQSESLARVNMTKFAVSTPGYQPHELSGCTCGASDWQGHYKQEHVAYQAAQARKAAEQALYRDMYPDDFGYYGDVA